MWRVLAAGLVIASAVTACSPEQEQFVFRHGDRTGCQYGGPEVVAPGEHEVVVFLDGFGRGRVDVYRLEEGASVDDIARFVESNQPTVIIPGLQRLFSTRVTDTNNVAGTGHTRTQRFDEGHYLFVCVNEVTDAWKVAGSFAVRS